MAELIVLQTRNRSAQARQGWAVTLLTTSLWSYIFQWGPISKTAPPDGDKLFKIYEPMGDIENSSDNILCSTGLFLRQASASAGVQLGLLAKDHPVWAYWQASHPLTEGQGGSQHLIPGSGHFVSPIVCNCALLECSLGERKTKGRDTIYVAMGQLAFLLGKYFKVHPWLGKGDVMCVWGGQEEYSSHTYLGNLSPMLCNSAQ